MRNNTLKKIAVAALSLVMVLSMSACGHQHTWTDATCTVPKTCSECGATEGGVLAHSWIDATCAAPKTCSACGAAEGEALPHTWQDVTCAAPKTCSVCGETEGEALPHTLTEANFQSPATCTVCGAEVGEPLIPSYEAHPFPLMEQGVTYDCLFAGYNNNDTDINGHVTLTNTSRFTSDETYPAMEGYEYLRASIELEFYGDEVWEYGGYNYGYLLWDYYGYREKDEDGNINNIGSFDEEGNDYFSLNFNGIEWEDCMVHYEESDGEVDYDARTCNLTLNFTMRVPVGYNGMIVVAHHPRNDVNTAEFLADVYKDGQFVAYRIV